MGAIKTKKLKYKNVTNNPFLRMNTCRIRNWGPNFLFFCCLLYVHLMSLSSTNSVIKYCYEEYHKAGIYLLSNRSTVQRE